MKIFAISDIHSFYDEMIEALAAAGFERDNPDHLLVCCGDYFDRGSKPIKVMNYLMSLNNVVLVKGNHEYLLEELIDKNLQADYYDIKNGTIKTAYTLANSNPNPDLSPAQQIKEVIKPFYDKMVNYFETENHVFVHGWVPITEDWRNGNWENASWVNGIAMSKMHNVTGKTVVVGHFHCSYGWSHLNQERLEFPQKSRKNWKDSFEIYRRPGLIAIDACTAYTGFVNVAVIEDNLLTLEK